jgi:hypothetical protein
MAAVMTAAKLQAKLDIVTRCIAEQREKYARAKEARAGKPRHSAAFAKSVKAEKKHRAAAASFADEARGLRAELAAAKKREKAATRGVKKAAAAATA